MDSNSTQPQQPEALAAPQSPEQPQQMQFQQQETGYDDIAAGLEEHLSSIPREQQIFLLDTLANPQFSDTALNFVGIVNGPEVYEYFNKLRQAMSQQNSTEGTAGAQQPAPQQPQQDMEQPPFLQPTRTKATPTA